MIILFTIFLCTSYVESLNLCDTLAGFNESWWETKMMEPFKLSEETIEYNETWWGPAGMEGLVNPGIRPFKVTFCDQMVKDLTARLKKYRRSSPSFPGSAFKYGFNTRELERWIRYWGKKYPFSNREIFFNKYKQFKVNVQGMDIHFVWKKAEDAAPGVETVPLLMLHGWPGSFRSFYDVIPVISAASPNSTFAVDIIAPSLPGFGFSDAPARSGLSAMEMAIVMRNLMHKLNYSKFYVYGEDWGAHIGSYMATFFPKEVLGYHTNRAMAPTIPAALLTLLGAIFPPLVVDTALADRIYPLTSLFTKFLKESGYLHEQSTKPDTIGIPLSDSPAGWLAYALQVISSATRKDNPNRSDGGLLCYYTKDALIDTLMVYWAGNSITSAMRIYAETFNKHLDYKVIMTPTLVPTWVIQPKDEPIYQSPIMLKTKFPNLIHTTVLKDGGHYLSLEQPEFLGRDIVKALKHFRKSKGGVSFL